MTSIAGKATPNRVYSVAIALSIACFSVSAPVGLLSAQVQKSSGTLHSSKRMADGNLWMTRNLDIRITPSYCYEGTERDGPVGVDCDEGGVARVAVSRPNGLTDSIGT